MPALQHLLDEAQLDRFFCQPYFLPKGLRGSFSQLPQVVEGDIKERGFDGGLPGPPRANPNILEMSSSRDKHLISRGHRRRLDIR